MSAEVFPSTNRGGKTNQYQLRVRIPLDLHKEMIRLAADAGISQSDYMVRLLADKVFDTRRKPEPQYACQNESHLAQINIPQVSIVQTEAFQFQGEQSTDDLMAVLRSRR